MLLLLLALSPPHSTAGLLLPCRHRPAAATPPWLSLLSPCSCSPTAHVLLLLPEYPAPAGVAGGPAVWAHPGGGVRWHRGGHGLPQLHVPPGTLLLRWVADLDWQCHAAYIVLGMVLCWQRCAGGGVLFLCWQCSAVVGLPDGQRRPSRCSAHFPTLCCPPLLCPLQCLTTCST